MNSEQSSKKWLWIGLGIFFLLLILGGLYWFFGRGSEVKKTLGELFPFGAATQNTSTASENGKSGVPSNNDQKGEMNAGDQEPMFRQLASTPIAGSYTLLRSGVEYVRYIEKETGHTYEVGVKDGVARQLTDTTIPRITLADWADNGNAVVLRYLEKDPLSGKDIIKTHLGRLKLPFASTSSPDQMGTLQIEFLPDNIEALSVAPDGKDLFYLMKTANGVTGSIINLGTKTTKEVFQSTFSEWLPQLLNDDTVIMTTKPSGGVPGYSYHYDPKTKTLSRLVRERKGLTTLGTPSGSRVLYGENITQYTTIGVYNPLGFVGDEGVVTHERVLPIATLPEKCAWQKDTVHILCGSFTTTHTGLIPDLWYQGVLSFTDTFWSVNTNTSELTFLADPKKEIQQEFDVMNPLFSPNEDYFVFTNKKDETLWSMHIPEGTLSPDATTLPVNLSPAELKDAQVELPTSTQGGAPGSTTVKKTIKK